ncbi:DUF3108 domain-containing protein [Pelobacter propionicus]|uniref:DUF3108 domain-containing protein n=1 Tax=Pelobacter propionicus (strain DSM 2379 / NBRC 103807 / OttBd1) TaxID=338966 RepID=A1ASV0_PELPD|nr:DUF3108 domain-containing protein [Pelobacter propionicus]ABL00421.1 conserved hypothetical protein [Pelobacter propionicus DSM 2379]
MPARCTMVVAMTVVVSVVLLVLSSTVGAFPVPERLEFEIRYASIPAGAAVQEVTRSGHEVHIVSTVRSATWLKLLFPVDDRVESILAPATPPQLFGPSRLYSERIREGWARRHRDARFDRQKHEVVSRDFLKKKETLQQIPPQTHDLLSGFFHLRMIPLQVGESRFIEIFDCEKTWNTEVQVLRREEISTPLGRFRTIVIKPLLKTPGIFNRSGDMFIWLTDDDRRIPVQMKSKVRLGSVTAILVGGSYWPEKR